MCREWLNFVSIFTLVEENFENQYPYMRLEWLILMVFIFTMVEENFEIPYPRSASNDFFGWYTFSPWLKKILEINTPLKKSWNSVPLDVLKMTNSNFIHLHHGCRKLWNSIPIDVPWMTKFCINLHLGWRKFWKSIPLHAPWMANFDGIHFHHGWRKFWNSIP